MVIVVFDKRYVQRLSSRRFFLPCRVRRPARAAGEGVDPAKKTERGADPRISENLRPISDKLDALCVVNWRAPAQSFPLPVERSITS